MRLLSLSSCTELSLTENFINDPPPYSILSHTWGADDDEVTFEDVKNGYGKGKAGYAKIQFCEKQARDDGIEYFWVDTCCIDKANHSELSEAIVSMFNWYHSAAKCYVYLSDVSTDNINNKQTQHSWESDLRSSRWFRRGWTLQELLAPATVEFFSRQGKFLGSKKTLEGLIHGITGIPSTALNGARLSDFTLDERLQWAAGRHTKRTEDRAYCLLGIFEIFMPLIYGEGENAFKRLTEEIDHGFGKTNATLPGLRTSLAVEQLKTLLLPSCGVPFRRDADFVDRGNFLNRIEGKCAQGAGRVALVGMGGVGKSQLAIEYSHRLRERLPNTWVFWVHASNAARIEQDYREIAERVKIIGRKDSQNNIFELVASWLRNEENGKWLLVLDNADEDTAVSIPQVSASKVTPSRGTSQLKRTLSAYLPQSANGALLVTTRSRSVATKLVEPRDVIPVGAMAESEAVALVKTKLDVTSVDGELEELVGVLEYMPLAVVQATSYIQQKGRRYDVRKYIEEFWRSDKRKTSLLNYEAGHLRRDGDAKNSIITTWQISFDYIKEQWPSSANLLSLMSFFDRQGIPKRVLTIQTLEGGRGDGGENKDKENEQDTQHDNAEERSSSDHDDDQFEEDIDRLQNFSFVSVGKDEQTFEMHGLVQLATRKWLEMQGECETWKARFLQKLNMILPTGKYEYWSQCEMLFPHTKSAERRRPAEDGSLWQWAQILRKAGWYAWAKGDYQVAERMCDKSVQALRTNLNAEDVDTSFSLGLLALVYRYQGRFAEAERIFKQVIGTRRRLLGKEHPHTLTSVINLASTYRQQGQRTEAEKIVKQVMATRTRLLGEEHPSTLSSLANLASTYRYQRRWRKAEKLFKQVIQTRRRVLGEKHPSTLSSMSNLAFTMRGKGRNIEAIRLMAECVHLRNQVLGDEHPLTLSSSAALTEWQSTE